jgi:hypothetical protein
LRVLRFRSRVELDSGDAGLAGKSGDRIQHVPGNSGQKTLSMISAMVGTSLSEMQPQQMRAWFIVPNEHATT